MAPTKTSASGATKSSAPQILYVSPEANRWNPPFHEIIAAMWIPSQPRRDPVFRDPVNEFISRGKVFQAEISLFGNFWLNFFQPGILIQNLQWTSASNQDTSAVLFSLCWLFASPSEVDKFMERATAGGESEDEDVRNFHTETETSATSRKLLLVILYQFYILY